MSFMISKLYRQLRSSYSNRKIGLKVILFLMAFQYISCHEIVYDSVKLKATFPNSSTTTISVPAADTYIDNDNSAKGFAGGTQSGTVWDATKSYLRLSGTTNNSELDSSWTPQWGTLVSYWKMNNTWTDSKGSNDGAVNGAPTFSASSKLGAAAGIFDGANPGSISVSVSYPNMFSISAWAYPSVVDGSYKCIFRSIPVGESLYIDNSNNFATYDYVSGTVSSGVKATTGTWYHLVATYDGTTKRMYVNGQLMASVVESLATVGGFAEIGGDEFTQNFAGKIDDLAVWSTELTAADIKTIYDHQSAKYSGTYTSRVFTAGSDIAWDGLTWTTPLPFGKELAGSSGSESTTDYSSLVGSTSSLDDDDLMSGIVGLWHMDEASWSGAAGEVIDSSGAGKHGVRTGSATTSAIGKFSRSGIFNGTTDGVVLPLVTSATSNMSFGAWFRTKNYKQSEQMIMFIGDESDAAGNSGFGISINMDFSTDGHIDYENAFFTWYDTGVAITDNNWHHVMVVMNTTSHPKIYLDGELIFTSVEDGLVPVTPITMSNIGRGNWGTLRHFNGQIDEAAVWSRKLSASEIRQLYRRGINQIKHQVRTCTTADCSDNPVWLGSAGNSVTYFTELQNNSSVSASGAPTGNVQTSLPDLLFGDFTSLVLPTRTYLQYRTIMESDDTGSSCDYGSGATWCSPELQSVEIIP